MNSTIRGRYKVVESLGSGGQGEVVHAVDLQHNRHVAVKIRKVGRTGVDEVLSEARLLLSLRPHPNLPVVREDFQDGDLFYMVMDWVEGTDLRALMSQRNPPRFSLDETVAYLAQAASALDHLHAHDPPIIHLDVKPENLILTSDGTLFLVDLGIAGHARTSRGNYGTRGYTAPEVLAYNEPSPEADVFSLAATAVTLIAGTPPGVGESLNFPELGSALPRVKRALKKGLALDPSKRFRRASDFVSILHPGRGIRTRSVPSNIPFSSTRFIGRAAEIKTLQRLLKSDRLVTVTGAPGAGKTRLALEVAEKIHPRFPDGVWLLELAAFDSTERATRQIATLLDVTEESRGTLQSAIIDRLQILRALLVFDNCEHLLPDLSSLIFELTENCPDLSILATSRERLGVHGESVHHLDPMLLPAIDCADASELKKSEAAALFLDRASKIRDPRLNLREITSVVKICHSVDGIPLALELLAARVNAMSLDDLASAVEHHTPGISGELSRGSAERHRTLESAIAWSFGLLEPRQATLFKRLSIFPGRFSLDAAAEISGFQPFQRTEVPMLLIQLVDRSLVEFRDEENLTSYRLLEPIRRATESPHVDDQRNLRSRYVNWHRGWLEAVEPELWGENLATHIGRLKAQESNIYSALSFALDDDPTEALRLVTSLRRYWEVRGSFKEGLGWTERAIEANSESENLELARALNVGGVLSEAMSAYAEAHSYHERALGIFRDLGDIPGLANSLNNLAVVTLKTGDFENAILRLDEAIGLYRQINDSRGIANCLTNLGGITLQLGQHDKSKEYLEEALEIRRNAGDMWQAAQVLSNLGGVAIQSGDHAIGKANILEALEIFRHVDDKFGIASSLLNLGLIEDELGNLSEARSYYEEALEGFRPIDSPWPIAAALGNLGSIKFREGNLAESEKLLMQALEIRTALGDLHGIAFVQGQLATLLLKARRSEEAENLLRESLTARLQLEDRRGIIQCIEGLAQLAMERKQFKRGARLVGSVLTLRRRWDLPTVPVEAAEFEELTRQILTDAPDASSVFEEVENWTLEEVSAFAVDNE